jgi:cyanophycin synthetase
MELWRLWVLRGPNTWAACPVIEVGFDWSAWADQPRQQNAEAIARLHAWLPSLAAEPEGTEEAVCLARVLQRLVVHLQVLAGNPVQFSGLRPVDRPHCSRVAIEYQEEPVGQACLQTALSLIRAAWEGRPFAIDKELTRLRQLADDQQVGPSTHAVVEAARARQIPVDPFNPEDGRYLRLGQGARQRRSLASETDDISALARSITTDKHLTKLLLREAGVPVPLGRPVGDAEDAWKAACQLGLPVAVKPQDRDMALGVGVNLRTRAQVLAAYEAARAKSDSILVERFLVGTEHRVLVVGDRVAAVARIEPPHVVGDGVSCIADLVAAVNRNPRHGDAYPAPLRRIKLDAVAIELLAAQGYTLESVPPRGVRVMLRRDPPHLDHGGYIRDVTDAIHPETAACAVAAAQALGVHIAGIDLVVTDIARPLEQQGGGVVEVNTGPGLGLHTAPLNESPRPVGAAIVASLFPPGSDGRIPVLAVTGSRAHTAGRCLSALLTDAGHRVGRAGRDGVFIAGRKINLEGATAYDKARAVLRNALVDVAVLECEARDLLREGFACDRCDVVLVTDPAEVEDSGDSARADAEDNHEEIARAWTALLHALAPDGKAILNADDPPAPSSVLPPADRLLWFAESGDNVRVTSHRAAGGTAVFLSADSLVVARGVEEQRLAFGGRPVERDPCEQPALLAALAGAMSLNQCGDEKPCSPPALTAPVEATLSAV